VAVVRLDDLLAPLVPFEHIRLIKIDVEGLEIAAIRGMERIIERAPNLEVVCELSPAWFDIGELDSWMSSRGYTGYWWGNGMWRRLDAGDYPSEQCDALYTRKDARPPSPLCERRAHEQAQTVVIDAKAGGRP
jgi:hypothetical protein